MRYSISDLIRIEITVSVAGKPADPSHELAAGICSEEIGINLSGGEPDELCAVLSDIAEAAEDDRLYGWMMEYAANLVVGAGEIVETSLEDDITRHITRASNGEAS